MKKLDKRLLRIIRQSKGQFIAVSVVIIVGILVYTSMSMAALNLEGTLEYYYKQNNFADIFVQVVKINEKSIKNIKQKFGFTEAQGRIVNDVPLRVKNDKEKVDVRVISIPDTQKQILQLYLKDGTFIKNKSNDVIVIDQFATARNIKVGDTIKPIMGGKEYNLHVCGIASSPEFIYLMKNEQTLMPQPDKFGVIYISNNLAQQAFGFSNSYNEIIITIKNKNDLNSIKDNLEKELDKFGVKRIIKSENQLSNRMIREEITQLRKSSSTVPLVFLVVAAIILMVMISRMVKNDRIVIGILKAMGFKNSTIISHYTKISLLIGIISGIFGMFFGTLLANSMTKMYLQFFNIPMLRTRFYIQFLFYAVGLSSAFCIFAGIWGARNVLKILPAESMRPESPKIGKRIFLEKIKIIWSNLTFSWKMVFRNILRNKKRFLLVTLGISLTFSITMMTTHLQSSSYEIFTKHYGEFETMDYNINFARPMNKKVINEITRIVDVKDIGPKVEFPFEIRNGWKNKIVNIIGVDYNTKFFNFVNSQNKKIDLPHKGIVLSQNLATYLDVKKGDKVKINTFIPNRDDIYIEVKDIIQQSLGINAYMDINYMDKELLDSDMIYGVYLNSDDNVKDKLNDANNISSVQSLQDLRDIFKQFLNMMIASIAIMVLFSGVLGFAIVYNSTVMSIAERRLEFSSLRVMGFKKSEIYRLIQKENMLITLIGIIIGFPIGVFMIKGIEKSYSNDLYTFSSPITLQTVIIAMVLTIIFVIVAQLSTLRKIYKLDFMESLKSRIS